MPTEDLFLKLIPWAVKRRIYVETGGGNEQVEGVCLSRMAVAALE